MCWLSYLSFILCRKVGASERSYFPTAFRSSPPRLVSPAEKFSTRRVEEGEKRGGRGGRKKEKERKEEKREEKEEEKRRKMEYSLS